MGRETYDVLIIGGGIAGVSIAYFLAKAGQRVCILEKHVLGQESTGRSAGNIGQSHRPPPDLPIAMRAVQLWKQLLQESDLDFEYRQHGNLRLAWTDAHVAKLKAMVERERAGGLECYFLDRAETHALLPIASGPFLGSVYSPSDGSAQPQLALLSLARAAVRQGAVLHERREVTGIEVVGGRVAGIATSGGPIASGVVVNAAGAWSPAIGRMAGVHIPAEARRSHLMITERLPQFMGPVVSTDFYGYFRQALSGNVLIGYSARPVEGFDRRVTFDAVSLATRRAAIIIPRLTGVSLIRAFTGFTVWTPDLLPIMGPVRQLDGLYVATAFCGLGFAIGPAVGELMAELILNGRASLPFDAYRLDRFEQPPGQVAPDLPASENMAGRVKTEGREE
jgi:sarcosine oxidase subunit beta